MLAISRVCTSVCTRTNILDVLDFKGDTLLMRSPKIDAVDKNLKLEKPMTLSSSQPTSSQPTSQPVSQILKAGSCSDHRYFFHSYVVVPFLFHSWTVSASTINARHYAFTQPLPLAFASCPCLPFHYKAANIKQRNKNQTVSEMNVTISTTRLPHGHVYRASTRLDLRGIYSRFNTAYSVQCVQHHLLYGYS
ncbi:hypothetical protein BD289DRAFT_423714 [Coniella lustricola]|uniref:Uncharacterized protein n=1 Tax=Coniella lustricola TaxID=2025994 RepID=A0A2T3AJF4_9PEZI|nr:hypothetical protein BD289DRAFT_423714 [Coniella lustricola]